MRQQLFGRLEREDGDPLPLPGRVGSETLRQNAVLPMDGRGATRPAPDAWSPNISASLRTSSVAR